MEAQPDVEQGVGIEQRAKAQEFKNSGNDKFNKNNYKGAIVDYQKGLLHEPHNPDLHANLSAAYLHLEKYIEAEEHALFSIHLRPNFYKGYMRAAKADHGKGMTRLALKRLAQGLSAVTDPNGLKELNRLKSQYTAYLALQSNNEREMEFDSDTYQSEDDEDEGLSTDDDSDDDQPPPFNGHPPQPQLELPDPPVPEPPAVEPPAAEPPDSGVNVLLRGLTCSKQEQRPTPESFEFVLRRELAIPVPEKVAISSESPGKVEAKRGQIEPPNETVEAKSDQLEPPNETDKPKALEDQGTESQKETPDDLSDKKKEHPLDWIREISRSSEMKKNIADFKDNLKTGGESYLSGNYRKAADCYKAAYEAVGKRYLDFETEERQCNVMRYASFAAMINLNTYDDIIKGIHGLNDMTKFAYDFPAIYLQIARGYFKLNRFKTALEPLEKVQEIIGTHPIFPTFIWPGTNEIIEETTPSGLKKSIKELNQLCRMSHKPTAVCRFDNCLKTSSHIVPSDLIYSSDPDFIGYVRMICEEKCHIEFHIPCWRSYKESVCGIGKINDKDFLGRHCLTTDCVNSGGEPSIITTIEIIGSDGQVKSVNRLDPKANAEQKAAEKKAKKKRSKLDDKENKDKVKKPKQTKEKENKVKTKEKKKIQIIQDDANGDEEDGEFTRVNTSEDPVKSLEIRRESLVSIRRSKFGVNEKNYWDPRYPFYGCYDESIKASKNQYLDQSSDPTEVRDAKEFIFSYFLPILTANGAQKLTDIEEQWKDQAEGFCDITVVLPNLTSICDLLMESTRFCQIEDRLCLAEQLGEYYMTQRNEVVDFVTYLTTAAANSETDSQYTDSNRDLEDAASSSEEDFDETSSDVDDSEDEESENDEIEYDSNFLSPPSFSVPPPYVIEASHNNGISSYPVDDIKKEMERMKTLLRKPSDGVLLQSSPVVSENDPSRDQPEESVSNETFETARGSSANTTSEDIKISNVRDSSSSESSNDDQREAISNGHMDSVPLDSRPALEPRSHSGDVSNTLGHNIDGQPQHVADESRINYIAENIEAAKLSDVFECSERDKGSQSKILMEEKQLQTSPLETKDRLSQTKESDVFKELNKKVHELASQLAAANKENKRLTEELVSERKIKKAQQDAISSLREENVKFLENKLHLDQLRAELLKKDKEFKRKEEDSVKTINNLKKLYESQVQDNDKLKREMTTLLKETAELKHSLTGALDNITEFQKSYQTLEFNMKNRLRKALQAQLTLFKFCWETQFDLHKKRCLEKMEELTNWLGICHKEVENHSMYPLIPHNMFQWRQMVSQFQQIEENFKDMYEKLEERINKGNDIDDLKPEMLPGMPQEPLLPPMEKILKEITDEHLKTINDLKALVANQQLEITKSKEKSEQLTQMIISNQMATPRMPPPLTTAFGSLALQYSYPGAVPPQFPGPTAPTVPNASQDGANIGNASELPDVQTLLQENAKLFGSAVSASSLLSPALKDEARSQTPPVANPYQYPPPLMPPPPTMPLPTMPLPTMPTPPLPTLSTAPLTSNTAPGTVLAMPPPSFGVAQNLLKNSSVVNEQKKDVKPVEQRAGTPKLEQKVGSSRDSTPRPVTPTPEKAKKKKKTKSVEAAAAEAKIAATVSLDSATASASAITTTATGEDAPKDDGGWNVVMPKSAMAKHTAPPPAPLTECKLKNKKKLLDKLQARFPTIQMKDLDDIVKQVREQNNGSLSGLPFDEIETRVERIITKRHLQKNSTMGLVKFSDAAWGTVKRQENIPWSNLQLEECTICLEPMGNERTKVDCNHEFHTKCLRKWLKEKSVCPLCNKFTTMPDEFPAL